MKNAIKLITLFSLLGSGRVSAETVDLGGAIMAAGYPVCALDSFTAFVGSDESLCSEAKADADSYCLEAYKSGGVLDTAIEGGIFDFGKDSLQCYQGLALSTKKCCDNSTFGGTFAYCSKDC